MCEALARRGSIRSMSCTAPTSFRLEGWEGGGARARLSRAPVSGTFPVRSLHLRRYLFCGPNRPGTARTRKRRILEEVLKEGLRCGELPQHLADRWSQRYLSLSPVAGDPLHESMSIGFSARPTFFGSTGRRPCERPQCLTRAQLVSGVLPQLWRYTGVVERSLEHVGRDPFAEPVYG